MKEDNQNIFISGQDLIYYPNAIKRIKKSSDFLKPIYEAFTNSLESIQMLETSIKEEEITIKFFYKKVKAPTYVEIVFDKIVFEDTGIGFDENNFERFKRFQDNSKGPTNLGSGRIQSVYFFKEIEYESVFKHNDDSFIRRFTLSNSPKYQQQNALIFYKSKERANTNIRKTILTFKELLDDKDIKHYNELNAEKLKHYIISHYIMKLCSLNDIPKIKIEFYVDSKLDKEESIREIDIPKINQQKEFKVFYSKLSEDRKSIFKTEKSENFQLKSFLIEKRTLDKNEIKFTCKGELVNDTNMKLLNLLPTDSIKNHRYLFLISGNYIDDNVTDTRDVLDIPTLDDFKKDNGLFTSEEIIIEDIESESNSVVNLLYPEIEVKKKINQKRIDDLKNMFLLNDEILSELSISINDSEEKILEKFYAIESKQIAKGASLIKKQIDDLNSLDPSSESYEEELTKRVDKLTKEIPLQNRAALTQYVARRKLVLQLFDKVLNKKLDIQNKKSEDGKKERNNNEKLLHNIIFKQKSKNTNTSDLWMIDEDFVLYGGASESYINDIEYEGEKIMKEDSELTKEQIELRDSLGQKRYQKRLDTILFPMEGKCVILEFKSPDEKLSDYLDQIQNYATIIRNFAKDKYDFTTFYGYLIGENFNEFEIRNKDPRFREAQYFNYLYRPVSEVAGYWGKKDGVIYTEIINYHTLLKRARERNNIFTDKIWKD